MCKWLPENAQRTLRAAQRTLRGRAKARRIAPRTLRGREEDVQRCSEDAQSTFRGRSEDAPRTRSTEKTTEIYMILCMYVPPIGKDPLKYAPPRDDAQQPDPLARPPVKDLTEQQPKLQEK